MNPANASLEGTLAYHQRSKHAPQRFAASPAYMDWDTQPDPFRTWTGAERTELPLVAEGVRTSYRELFSAEPASSRPLDLPSVSGFLELSLGLTAWKEYQGTRWALRADPSSGNLHPTEGYLITAGAPGLAGGVHHYLSRDHLLEQRCALDAAACEVLAAQLGGTSFLVGLSSIHWREAWKYGERAFRYCQHDVGHVIGTLRFAAAALGWSVRLLVGFGDRQVASLLGLDREADHEQLDDAEREHPDCLLLVTTHAGQAVVPLAAKLESHASALVDVVAAGSWSGRPSELSSEHLEWGAIDQVADATRRAPSPNAPRWEASQRAPLFPPSCALPAQQIIRQRRSAMSLDGKSSLPRDVFYAMLERTLPAKGVAPFDVLPFAPRLHLGIFVHLVEGIEPGLYIFERSEQVHAGLLEELGSEAPWTRPEGCPEGLRLFLLGAKDVRRAAQAVSCDQAIAADGAFSLGMIAEYRETLARGAHHYRDLFWEAGLIGQTLYLEAEAAGLRGTGIGCYFDDAFHQLMGLESDRYQSLYHFTIGGPLEDTRLATLPAYAHLGPERTQLGD
ncbi:MAG: SagB-type dehydrogenase family enzyme [Planctomycetota bacterium]|jgi:SagB-type dehydrogenase family enzyme